MNRPVEMMRTTDYYISLDLLARRLILKKPDLEASVLGWQRDIKDQYGSDLTINWYVIHVGQMVSTRAACAVTDFNEERYGEAYAPKPVDHERRIQTLVDLEILR